MRGESLGRWRCSRRADVSDELAFSRNPNMDLAGSGCGTVLEEPGRVANFRNVSQAASKRLREVTATVRGKVLLAFCALAAITAFLGFSAISSVTESGRLVVQTYDKSLMSISYARLGLSVFMQMELALAELRSSSDVGQRQALEDRLKQLSRSLTEDLGVVRSRVTSDRAAIALNDTARSIAQWEAS